MYRFFFGDGKRTRKIRIGKLEIYWYHERGKERGIQPHFHAGTGIRVFYLGKGRRLEKDDRF